jgi:hypothetical protein
MRFVVTLWLAVASSSALAQDLGGYAGVAVGGFDHRNETGGSFSDSVSTWRLYGGVLIGEHFGLEFGRGRTSAIDVAAPGAPLSVATRRLNAARRVDFNLATFKAMGRLPFKRFDLWMAYGALVIDADVDFTSALSGPSSLSVDEERELVALGVDWRLGRIDRAYVLRFEYERLNLSFSDASILAVGVAYRFGGL